MCINFASVLYTVSDYQTHKLIYIGFSLLCAKIKY